MAEVEIHLDLSIAQTPVSIVASEVKHLRSKDVPLVKVQWSENPKDCSWETREYIERTFPALIQDAH